MKTLISILLLLPLKSARVETVPIQETKPWNISVSVTEYQITVSDNYGNKVMGDFGGCYWQIRERINF